MDNQVNPGGKSNDFYARIGQTIVFSTKGQATLYRYYGSIVNPPGGYLPVGSVLNDSFRFVVTADALYQIRCLNHWCYYDVFDSQGRGTKEGSDWRYQSLSFPLDVTLNALTADHLLSGVLYLTNPTPDTTLVVSMPSFQSMENTGQWTQYGSSTDVGITNRSPLGSAIRFDLDGVNWFNYSASNTSGVAFLEGQSTGYFRVTRGNNEYHLLRIG